MSLKRILAVVALVCTSLLVSASAFAGPATDMVKSKQTTLFAVVAQPKTEARQKKLRKLFDEVLAYQVFAENSLGKKWSDRSAAEQTKFSGLLTKLVRNNYRRNLKKMLDFEITYVGEKAKDGGTLVQTRAKHKTDAREPAIEIDFLVSTVGGKQMITDIITERASMVKTYKSQFLRILRKKGFDKLIEKMEKKLAKQNK
ncbi:MAG: ABC transporter substrate-binding protein, partial [Deltaproteobacteria bacterium]|nr:ABC transporter substrate-binding protein [Deltaproteobacteria bacterium]